MSNTMSDAAATAEVAKSCRPGYIYWCSSQHDYAHVKNGYTTSHDPIAYCEEQYSRTMVPLEIIAVIPVANAALMEKLSHYALHPLRVHGRHEVFDLSLDDGSLDRTRLDSAIKVVTVATELSGLPLPEDPEIVAQRRVQEKFRLSELRRQQADKRKAERGAEKQAEKERVKQQRLEEVKQLAQDQKQERESQKRLYLDKLTSDINNFISSKCLQAPCLNVAVSSFKKILERHFNTNLTANNIKKVMSNLGFRNRKTRTVRVFIGLSVIEDLKQ